MTDKEKRYWSYFLNVLGQIQFCEMCVECKNECKQSFRIRGILCRKFEAR